MLQHIDTDIWIVTHPLRVNGLWTSTRMTVIRLSSGGLILHSPVPIDVKLELELQELGPVEGLIAPNKMHYLFLLDAIRRYPKALVFATPGLGEKRPELAKISSVQGNLWGPELRSLMFEGCPALNETIWFHAPSRTLIATDLFQWFSGDISFALNCWASLVGARKQMAVPRHVRLLIRDRLAARNSVQAMLQLPFIRVLFAHNGSVNDANQSMTKEALRFLA